jgi:hypothetical protein
VKAKAADMKATFSFTTGVMTSIHNKTNRNLNEWMEQITEETLYRK